MPVQMANLPNRHQAPAVIEMVITANHPRPALREVSANIFNRHQQVLLRQLFLCQLTVAVEERPH